MGDSNYNLYRESYAFNDQSEISETKSASNGRLEFREGAVADDQLPVEIPAHLALHFVDLVQGECAPGNDIPGTIEVGAIVDHFGGNNESGEE